MENRTDLALESYESSDKTKLNGVIVKENDGVTVVEVVNSTGAKALSKPVGKYITCTLPSLVNDTDMFDGRLDKSADLLRTLLPENVSSVLVAGIGNLSITADALGPKSNDYVLATRHIMNDNNMKALGSLFNVSSVTTGVLGNTGIESAEIVRGVAERIKPSCVIAIDALAASSPDRLGNTLQLSDTGIAPGSGVGNHRYEISEKTLGIPVISIGIPTVISASVMSENNEPMFVTPREIDRVISQGAKLIGMTINVCLQKNLSAKDLFSLVG
ncbi:MAG: GPR endopeptidase [Eubacterium sp.]|nr:GPR endopeptidase [Eubacterium sp.]